MLRPTDPVLHPGFAIDEPQRRGPVTVLVLSGRLDGRAAQQLLQRFADLRGPGFNHLALDLSKVTFLASTGLGAFLAETEARKEAGRALYLVAPSPVVSTVIQLINVDRFLTIAPSVEAVLGSLPV